MCPTPDGEDVIITRILEGETALYDILMRRYNQRLYHAALSIVGDPDEAEDAIQDAFIEAWLHLNQFTGRARFSTWLTRIAIRQAWSRLKKKRRYVRIGRLSCSANDFVETVRAAEPNPEAAAMKLEAGAILEAAIMALRPQYRSVLVLRDIDGLSTAETAQCLDIDEENVKIRLHRARRILRRALSARTGANNAPAFEFLGERCEEIRTRVLQRIGMVSPAGINPTLQQAG
jgi:RNA polymerase sigma-70 factor, ECF subfamily